MRIVNTRADLDALAASDPAAHAAFIGLLRASAVRVQDVADYPPGYGDRGYEGPAVEPSWRTVEDMTTLNRFGFGSLAELPDV